jgi:hypothetical protein
MTNSPHNNTENLDAVLSENNVGDPLWVLLESDAATFPVEVSPWFAARTTALVRSRIPSTGFLRRCLIAVPLAALAALMITLNFSTFPGKSATFISSEEEFEQHMEMLFASAE